MLKLIVTVAYVTHFSYGSRTPERYVEIQYSGGGRHFGSFLIGTHVKLIEMSHVGVCFHGKVASCKKIDNISL